MNWTLRNTFQWNFNQSTKLFIHENAFKNIVYEMAAILPRGDELNVHERCTINLNLTSACISFVQAMNNRALHILSLADMFVCYIHFLIQNSKWKTMEILLCSEVNSQNFCWWDICKKCGDVQMAGTRQFVIIEKNFTRFSDFCSFTMYSMQHAVDPYMLTRWS